MTAAVTGTRRYRSTSSDRGNLNLNSTVTRSSLSAGETAAVPQHCRSPSPAATAGGAVAVTVTSHAAGGEPQSPADSVRIGREAAFTEALSPTAVTVCTVASDSVHAGLTRTRTRSLRLDST